MKLTILQIKLIHTAIFWVLSGCVLLTLFSGLADRVTMWTVCTTTFLVACVIIAIRILTER